MTTSITEHDLRAAIDLIDAVVEESDSTPFEEAVALRDALVDIQRKARDAIGLLDTQMMTYLEAAPRRIGDRTFEVCDKTTWRFRHEEILDAIADTARREAVNPETGEINITRLLALVARYVNAIYLSPSVQAKVGGLRAVGLTKRDVGSFERVGKEIKVIDRLGGAE